MANTGSDITHWHVYDGGSTIDRNGSEEGVILRDEEHPDGARITLERDARAIPFAITCGIYGLLVHTHYCGTLAEAEQDYAAMKVELGNILIRIPATDDPKAEDRMRELYAAVERFVSTLFP
jgi:hypothetical protein